MVFYDYLAYFERLKYRFETHQIRSKLLKNCPFQICFRGLLFNSVMATANSDSEEDPPLFGDGLSDMEEEEALKELTIGDVKETFKRKSDITTPKVNSLLQNYNMPGVETSGKFKVKYQKYQAEMNKVSGHDRSEKVQIIKDSKFILNTPESGGAGLAGLVAASAGQVGVTISYDEVGRQEIPYKI